MNYFPMSRLLLALTTLLAVLILTGCATGPSERRIELVNVVRDAAGAVVEGDPGHTAEVVDLWTFARNTRSRDPNWLLVATGAPQH